MVVVTQYQGRRISGLYIGAGNANRYFSRRATSVEIQIDHLRICCGLAQRFWEDAPEIQDARLCAWLESKQTRCSVNSGPWQLALTPAGRNIFRLDSLSSKNVDRLRSAAVAA